MLLTECIEYEKNCLEVPLLFMLIRILMILKILFFQCWGSNLGIGKCSSKKEHSQPKTRLFLVFTPSSEVNIMSFTMG